MKAVQQWCTLPCYPQSGTHLGKLCNFGDALLKTWNFFDESEVALYRIMSSSISHDLLQGFHIALQITLLIHSCLNSISLAPSGGQHSKVVVGSQKLVLAFSRGWSVVHKVVLRHLLVVL